MSAGAEYFEVRVFPDPSASKRYAQLVGLKPIQERLLKEAEVLLDRSKLTAWNKRHHSGKLKRIIHIFTDRAPLFIFSGDIGTGKTALAETFPDEVARAQKLGVTEYKLSLHARGSGLVGEMSSLIAKAFEQVISDAEKLKSESGRPRAAVVLFIDEADALAQSRELSQMHHEDRAGVNSLIRGLDRISGSGLPILVVLSTNRLEAIDPAVRRRAADTFIFVRPDQDKIREILSDVLGEAGFDSGQCGEIAAAMAGDSEKKYGYTYSDIYHRYFPALLLIRSQIDRCHSPLL